MSTKYKKKRKNYVETGTGKTRGYVRKTGKGDPCVCFLDKLGVIYDRVDHEALMTMEACEEADRVLEATICKNLFLCTANKKEFYLLMIVGDKRLVTKDVSKKLGTSRLSFASESYMEEYLDITPGSVSVLGLMNDTENHVQLVIDEDVLKGEYVGCHPCINTSSLRVRTADLMEKIIPAMHHEAKIIRI